MIRLPLTTFYLVSASALLLYASCNVVEKLANTPPVIEAVIGEKTLCNVGDTLWVEVDARDVDEDPLSASWTATGGLFIGQQGLRVDWVAPQYAGVFTLIATVRDDKGGETEDRISITVLTREKPAVRITRPQDGAFIPALGNLTIQADAEPAGFITIEFVVNNIRRAIDAAPPYTIEIPLAGLSGLLDIEAVASRLDAPAMKSADSVRVFVQGVVPIPRPAQRSGRK